MFLIAYAKMLTFEILSYKYANRTLPSRTNNWGMGFAMVQTIIFYQ